jgi:hypothetical protein
MQLRLGRIGLYAAAIVLVLWSSFPLFYAIVTSFATGTQMFVPNYWPPTFDLSNYSEVFGRGNMAPALLNSIVVAGVTVLAALVMGLFAAFAFSRVRFRGRKLLLVTILSTTMFPQIAILAGLYELMTRLGLYNSIWAVMFSYLILVLPFSVWILTGFHAGPAVRDRGRGYHRRRLATCHPDPNLLAANVARDNRDRSGGSHRRLERVPVRFHPHRDTRSSHRPRRHPADLGYTPHTPWGNHGRLRRGVRPDDRPGAVV